MGETTNKEVRFFNSPSVSVVSISKDALILAVSAARRCYDPDMSRNEKYYRTTSGGKVLTRDGLKLLLQCLHDEHFSVLEHVTVTWSIEQVARADTHQLVRKRIASFSQHSQHWCIAEPTASALFPYGVLVDFPQRKELEKAYEDFVTSAFKMYSFFLSKNVPKELARKVLPEGTGTKIWSTMNLHGVLDFFRARLCRRNTPDMYYLAWGMFNSLLYHFGGNLDTITNLRDVMRFFMPKCVSAGKCNESKSCGNSLAADFNKAFQTGEVAYPKWDDQKKWRKNDH